MSDEEREFTPSEPVGAPSPTDVPSAEPAEVPPSDVIVEPAPTPAAEETEAPSMSGANLGQDVAGVGGSADDSAAPIPPTSPPPPLPPAIITEIPEVTGDDKLLAALAWFTMVIFQLPILSIVLLLIEPNRNRPFQRYHAVTSIAFWCVALIYEIVAGLAVGMLTLVTLGIFAVCMICLWVIFVLPHIVALIYAFYALTGRTPEIPVITKLAREQKWI